MSRIRVAAGRFPVLLLLFGGACAGEPGGEVPAPDSAADLETGVPLDREAQTQTVVELEHPGRVALGRSIQVTVHLRNQGPGPVDLGLTGDPVAVDLWVRNESGRLVWERLHGQMGNLVLQLRRLEAGEAMTFEYEWDLRDNDGVLLPPGRYRLEARVPAGAAELVSAESELIVEG